LSIDKAGGGRAAQGILGSLREALAAASRDETKQGKPAMAQPVPVPVAPPPLPQHQESVAMMRQQAPSAADAARDARGGTPNVPPADKHMEPDAPPTTRVVRASSAQAAGGEDASARTQFVRGKGKIARQKFHQDPVVGWLVVVGGPGLGAYRPIYEGNNTVGRSANQRVPIDFGDDAISAEEQAYLRYDGGDRSFLFVPNLAKTNVVAVNDKRPTSAVVLQAMDVITVGRTQLVFVPFCGPDFDWADISEAKA
jgi:hypothetical protein